MPARYAIYFAPARGSDLARFGDRWLGREVETGASRPQSELPTVSPQRLRELTEAPRHYGFHGTLKAPFVLAADSDAVRLQAAMAAFAAGRSAFAIPRLMLAAIGEFLALTPAEPIAPLDALAAACVETFDAFRKPPEPRELAKRLAAGLTRRQSELLARWGYPYVFDEFRFHLTLTGPIADAAERETVRAALRAHLDPILAAPVPVEAVSLFHQAGHGTPFRLTARYGFGR